MADAIYQQSRSQSARTILGFDIFILEHVSEIMADAIYQQNVIIIFK